MLKHDLDIFWHTMEETEKPGEYVYVYLSGPFCINECGRMADRGHCKYQCIKCGYMITCVDTI